MQETRTVKPIQKRGKESIFLTLAEDNFYILTRAPSKIRRYELRGHEQNM